MKKITIFIAVLTIFIAATYLWWGDGLLPVNPQDKTEKIFVIKKGAGLKEIANNLGKEGLIKNSIVFFLYTRKERLEGKIQAGDFRLSPSMTAEKIAKILTHGTLDVWMTIPEGKRAEEIADLLSANIPSYKEFWRSRLVANEGYLFPDTYLIPKDADIDLVLPIMKGNFDKKIAQIGFSNKSNLTRNGIVILASIIEREAKFPTDRLLVASVLLNRLKISMPLQADATIQYALGYQQDKRSWWKKSLTREDLKIDSPYNTYINTGLPPTPISNPGLEALKAATNPGNSDYLYYLSDKLGRNHYARTLEEHNQNIKTYGLQ